MMEARMGPGRTSRARGWWLVWLVSTVVALAGCAGGPRGTPGSQSPAGAPVAESASPAKTTKTLHLSSIKENSTGIAVFTSTHRDQYAAEFLFHEGLTVLDAQGNVQPRLAQKVPSIGDGDWKINA